MKIAVFTVSLPDYTPQEAVKRLRDYGYDGVEWRVTDQQSSQDARPGFWASNRCTWPLSTFLDDVPKIRSLTDTAGLAMPALGTYAGCSDMKVVEQAIRGAAALGVPQLRINVPKYDGQSEFKRLRDSAKSEYRDVAAVARDHGVRALAEIHHRSIVPSASAAASFLDGLDPQDVGVIHDAGNMVYEGFEQYRLGLETLGPYLAHVHIKDAAWHERPAGGWEAAWAPIGEGIVDFAALFAALRDVGYDRWVSVEDFSTTLPLEDRLQQNIALIRTMIDRAA
jgi:sugar phosphate isomerase/epimerase